jgi:trigger factor
MQVSIEAGEGLERRMTVALPANQVQEAVDERLKKMTSSLRMDGFRPGKVPLRVVRQRYGKSVRQEVMGDLIQSSFMDATKDQGVVPAGPPRIDDLDLDAASYVAVFDVMPEVTIADLSETTIKRPRVAISEADIDALVEKLREQRASWTQVDRPAEDNDQLLISFTGFIDDEAFDGGAAEDVTVVLGANSMIDGFESGLMGAGAGEDRSLQLTFPADYRVESLAGKEARFEVAVKEVRHQVLPDIDEDFIKEFGVESGTMADFRADIHSNMTHELDQKLKSTVKNRVMDALYAAHEIDVPKFMVEQESETLKEQTLKNMARQSRGSNINLPSELFNDQAKRRVVLRLLIDEIIDENGFSLDEARVEQTIAEMAKSYDDPQEMIDYYRNDKEAKINIGHLVMEDQVVDWLMERMQVEDESEDFESFMNPERD